MSRAIIRTFNGIVMIFLIFVQLPAFVGALNLTILHTNDIHSRFLSFNSNIQPCTETDILNRTCWGGVAKRVAMIKSIRATYENVILLDAGDQFQGSAWYTLMKWRPVAAAMNLMNYTVATLGNHEFDDGDENLADYLRSINFPMISSNIDVTKSQLNDLISQYYIMEIQGELLAFIGCTSVQTTDTSSPSRFLSFHDEISSFNRLVGYLQKTKNVDKIIALSHSGLEKERRICAAVPGLDLIVGGHSHTFMYQGTPPLPNEVEPEAPYPEVIHRPDGPCLIVQAFEYGKYLGFLQISFDQTGRISHWGGNPMLLDSSIKDDADTKVLMEMLGKNLTSMGKQVVALTTAPLTSLNGYCRIQECPIGNFVSDALLKYAQEKLQTFINSANDSHHNEPTYGLTAINGGILRQFSSSAGVNITLNDLYNLLPFSNTIKVVKLNGTLVRKLFEHSIKNFSLANRLGKFLQISNANVTYYMNCSSGEFGVESVKIGCMLNCHHVNSHEREVFPLDDRNYTVVMTSYIAGGGDGYGFVRDYGMEYNVVDALEIDVVLDHVKRAKGLMGGKLENRLNFEAKDGQCDPRLMKLIR